MKNKIRKVPIFLFYGILIIYLFYSFKHELVYNEIDNITRMLIPTFIFIGLFIKYLSNDINELNLKEFIKKYIILLFLALCWAKTFNRYILPLHTGFTKIILLDTFGSIFQALAIMLVIIELLKKIEIKRQANKTSWYAILLYAIPSLFLMFIVWLSFYPALMMSDSNYIWSMVNGSTIYNDMHPITYTIMLKIQSFIWNSPAVIVLSQILLTSFAIGFSGWTLQKIGLPKIYCWIAVLAMTLYPITWIYSVTVLKDIYFTMAMVIFMDIILLALFKPNEIFNSIKWYVFAGIIALFAMYARHNGILAVAGTIIIAAIVFIIKHKRQWVIKLACLLCAIIVLFYGAIFIIQLSLGDNFYKQPVNPLLYTQPIHHIASVYGQFHEELDDETLALIDKYLVLKSLDSYLFGDKSSGIGLGYYAQNIYNNGDWEQINNNPKGFFSLWLDIIKRYPVAAFISSQKLNSIVWYSNDYGFTTKFTTGSSQLKGDALIKLDSKMPKAKAFFINILNKTSNFWVFWRPAWAMVFSLILAYIALKRKGYKSLFVILPMLLNNMGLLIAVPFPDTRFVYLNIYTFIVFTLYALSSSTIDGNKNIS